MNIKRAKEVVIQLCHKAGSPWLRTENVMEILEALDEPICICMDKGSVYGYSSKCHVHGVGLEPIVPRKTPFDDYHYCQGWDAAIREHAQPKENEIKQLKAHLANAKQSNESLSNQAARLQVDLAIANGLVKNLEEKLKFKEDFKYGFVSKTEYEELNADCYKKRDRIDKYFASCEKIREILTELQRSLHV